MVTMLELINGAKSGRVINCNACSCKNETGTLRIRKQRYGIGFCIDHKDEGQAILVRDGGRWTWNVYEPGFRPEIDDVRRNIRFVD